MHIVAAKDIVIVTRDTAESVGGTTYLLQLLHDLRGQLVHQVTHIFGAVEVVLQEVQYGVALNAQTRTTRRDGRK